MKRWTKHTASAAASAIILAATVTCALPWPATVELHRGAGSAAILIPIAAICACIGQRPWQTPSLVVFLSGLLMDVVTAGALGYWALVYLAAASTMRALAVRIVMGSGIVAWLMFALAATLAAAVAWTVSSLYRLQLAPASEVVVPAVVAVAAYPLIAACTRALLALVAPEPAPAIRSPSE